MTDFVIDANVLMSILISGKATYRPILSFNNFILPDFALVEIEQYKETLKIKTKLSSDQFIQWTYIVFSECTVLPMYVIEEEAITKSVRLLEKIDMKDLSYVTLSMQLDIPLLTRDIPLYEGLRKQGYKKTMLFEDFLRTI